MSTTRKEGGRLTTRVPERGMDVTTTTPDAYRSPQDRALRRAWYGTPSWTIVWSVPDNVCLFQHFWPEPHSSGGLAEAHEAIVDQVRRGLLPSPEGSDRG